MQVAYSNHNMSAKLTSNDLVVVTTDLTTSASYHFIWNLDVIKKLRVSTCTEEDRMKMAQGIAVNYAAAAKLDAAGDTKGEQEIIQDVAMKLLTHYVANSKAFGTIESVNHNTVYVAIDHGATGYVVRPIGTSYSEDTMQATENAGQALAMAQSVGFATIDKSNASGLTMLGVTTPGTRVNKPKPGAPGSNMTPKKKKRNKRK